jgi:hypothetical protein
MVFDQSLYAPHLHPAEPRTPLQPHGIEPELGPVVLALNVDVWRFITIAGVEEEPVRASAQRRRHCSPSLAATLDIKSRRKRQSQQLRGRR